MITAKLLAAIATFAILLSTHTVESYRCNDSRYRFKRLSLTNSGKLHRCSFFCVDETTGVHVLEAKELGVYGENDEQILVEVTTNRPFITDRKILRKISSATYEDFDEGSLQSYDDAFDDGRVYQEYQEETKVEKVLDSSAGKFLGILLQPSTLLLFMWAAGNWSSWMQKTWVQKVLKIFGRGMLAKNSSGDLNAKPVVLKEDLPFQTFECEKCQMQMKPAKGRAEVIFGKARFRCSRCGSKADAYFDVDDMTDPRAIARAERIKKEEERRAKYEDLEEDDLDEEEDDMEDFDVDDDDDE